MSTAQIERRAGAPSQCEYRHCNEALVQTVGVKTRKYCSESHGKLERKARGRDKARVEAADDFGKPGNRRTHKPRSESSDGRGSARRPPEWFLDSDWPELIFNGDMSQIEAAEAIAIERDVPLIPMRVSVTRWMTWWAENKRVEAERKGWQLSDEAQRAKNDFPYFRSRYFKVARGRGKGLPPVTMPFHLRWILAILGVLPIESGGTAPEGEGGQQLILSPPRFGKSLLLAHFVIWLIVRNPDIAIIWVSGNEKIAKRFGSLVRDELERNKLLIEDFCGPGGSFKPDNRQGAEWRDDQLEVATRTTPQPAPTLVCVGRGGQLLSMDADLIVSDDLDSNKTIRQPAQREQGWEWFNTDLASRKEEHTAWVFIGSRQANEDIAGKLLEMPDLWPNALVEQAHDPDCALDPDDYTLHEDCLLWPGMRSYKFLMQKRGQIGKRLYNLQYHNNPDGDAATPFVRADIEACFNHSRPLGLRGLSMLPANTRLIGGLDPAAKGMQVAFLWGAHRESQRFFMVDAENERAGSIPHLVSVMRRWYQDYGLTEWVYEENSNNAAWLQAKEVREVCAELGITIRPHTTDGYNKHDNLLGVTAMQDWFAEQREHGRRIDLPYGDDAARLIVDEYAHQLRNYSTERTARSSAWKTDIVMGAWFPWHRIVKEWRMELATETDDVLAGDDGLVPDWTAASITPDWEGLAA